ncbi:MAG: serine/threonine protein kinase [Bacillota bacterium]|nr:serine/threonine protein kinase [Bacillota bacterium]
MDIEEYRRLIEEELLPYISLETESPFDPIKVRNDSSSWKTIGSGNYAAVFGHEGKRDWVVKVYGRNHEEINKEIAVYQSLGNHEAFSALYDFTEKYLILKRMDGITLFNAVIKGIQIPPSVIKDIDDGLEFARKKGLNPYDVHGKNVVMHEGKGYIVDISDFYKAGYCSKWEDLKKAYHRIYRPFMFRFHPPIPFAVVDAVRKGYRFYKKMKTKNKYFFKDNGKSFNS